MQARLRSKRNNNNQASMLTICVGVFRGCEDSRVRMVGGVGETATTTTTTTTVAVAVAPQRLRKKTLFF